MFKICLDFWGHVEKQLDNKAKLVSNIVTSQTGWETNNYNTHIAQYVKK